MRQARARRRRAGRFGIWGHTLEDNIPNTPYASENAEGVQLTVYGSAP
jgi:hypothetical protein